VLLTGKVVKLESADEFTDKKQRAHIRVDGADVMYSVIRVPNEDKWTLDQVVSVFVHTEEKVPSVSTT
jgi:hypothetical protein